MTALLKLIYTFNTNPIKISKAFFFFPEIVSLVQNLYGNAEEPELSNNLL